MTFFSEIKNASILILIPLVWIGVYKFRDSQNNYKNNSQNKLSINEININSLKKKVDDLEKKFIDYQKDQEIINNKFSNNFENIIAKLESLDKRPIIVVNNESHYLPPNLENVENVENVENLENVENIDSNNDYNKSRLIEILEPREKLKSPGCKLA